MQALLQQIPEACSNVYVMAKAPTASFGPLMRTVCEAIFEVFLMCSMGWLLAYRGMLDKKTQKQLNKVNVSLFTPCLLFSKVAFSLSPAKLKELWIIPILFVVVTGVSALVAYALGTVLRLRRSQRNFAMAASMFNNSNSLPIALMQSLVVTVKGLKWGSDDTKDAMLGRALGYLVLYSTLGMMLRWSYGVHLLAQSDEEVMDDPDITITEPTEGTDALVVSSPVDETLSLPPSTASSSSNLSIKGGDNLGKASYLPVPPRPQVPVDLHRAVSGIAATQASVPSAAAKRLSQTAGLPPLRPPAGRTQSKRFFSSFPNSPARSTSPSPTSTPTVRKQTFKSLRPPIERSSDEEEPGGYSPGPFDNARERTRHQTGLNAEQEYEETDGSDSEWGTHVPRRSSVSVPSASRAEQLGRRTLAFILSFWVGFLTFMTMPLYAAAASMIVALTPPLQHVLDEHVAPVKGFLNSAGSCSIPVTLVVLGAYFYQAPAENGKDKSKKSTGDSTVTVKQSANGKSSPPLLDLGTGHREDIEAYGAHASGSSTVYANGGATPRAIAGDGLLLPSHHLPIQHTDDSDLSDDNNERTPRPTTGKGNGNTISAQTAEQSPVASPWTSATTLAGSMRSAFRMRGLRERLSRSRQRGKGKAFDVQEAMTAGETKTVVAAIMSRMILTPIIVLPMVAALAYFDLHPVFDDPVFVCSTVLLISSPPALTLAQITQAASGDAFERLISRTIFWAYCVATPPLTLFYVIIALHFSRL